MKPTLSVCMPNYNDGQTITQSLEAICNQSLPPTEVVVVDDCSTDNSVEIIRELADQYPIIKLVRNDRNLGCVGAMRVALEHSTGHYIYSASANDLVLPGMFEHSLNTLQAYPEAPMCCGDVQIYDEATGSVKDVSLNWSESPCYFDGAQVIELIRKSQLFYGISVIAKRAEILAIGYWRPDLYWCADFFPYSVLSLRGGTCYVPQLTGKFTLHSSSRWKEDGRSIHIGINRRIVELLKSPEFSDVAPAFVRSGVITLPFAMKDFLVDHIEHWDLAAYDSRLLRAVVEMRAIRETKRMIPSPLKRVYRAALEAASNRSGFSGLCSIGYHAVRIASTRVANRLSRRIRFFIRACRPSEFANGSDSATEQKLVARYCWERYFKCLEWMYSYYSIYRNTDPEFAYGGIKVGRLDSEITEKLIGMYDRLQPIFFRKSDHLPHYAWTSQGEEEVNRDHVFRRVSEQYLTLLHDALKQMRADIQRCLGSPFTVVGVLAWETEAKEQTFGMNDWHTDSFPERVYKLMLYVSGASIDKGTTEIRTRTGSSFVVESGPGTWLLFRNNELEHRGIPPKGEHVRKIVQVTLVPSFLQDERPIDAGASARYPIYPWDMLRKGKSIELDPRICRADLEATSEFLGSKRDVQRCEVATTR